MPNPTYSSHFGSNLTGLSPLLTVRQLGANDERLSTVRRPPTADRRPPTAHHRRPIADRRTVARLLDQRLTVDGSLFSLGDVLGLKNRFRSGK